MTTLAPKLPYSHPFAGGYPRIGGQPLPTDPDAIDYLDRVAAADGAAVEQGVAMAVDGFVRGCKADGIWDAIKASCIMAGARTLTGALVPLVGTAPTPYNFASADYNRSTGLKGDGSTTYLDTNRAGNADGQDDSHGCAYITGGITTTNGRVFGVGAGLAGDNKEIYRDGGGGMTFRCNTASVSSEPSQGGAVGFVGVSRDSAASFDRRINAATTSPNIASVASSPQNIAIFAGNENGTVKYFSNARLAFYSLGSAISDLAALDARVSTLISAIAAALS